MPSLVLPLVLSILFALQFEAPKGWEEGQKSMMKVADWKLPKADGETDEATCSLYNFGARMGGSAEANIQRWLGQFDPKEGEPKVEKPKEGEAIKLTFVDVSGTYKAETRPGSGVRLNKPGWRMIAAVIESGDDMYFVKAIGPKATIEKNAEAIRAYVKSAKKA